MQPTAFEPRDDTAGRRPYRASLAAVTLLLFATIASVGTIASLGTYCLTSDGGDSRALDAIRGLTSSRPGDPGGDTAETASGVSCPLPRHPRENDPMPTATTVAARPSADLPAQLAGPSRATAVFALG